MRYLISSETKADPCYGSTDSLYQMDEKSLLSSSQGYTTINDDWHKLLDVYYHKRHVWNMNWESNHLMFSRYFFAAAPLSGPIAMISKQRASHSDAPNHLMMYSARGSISKSVEWRYDGLITLGWSALEILVTVFLDGTVRCFSSFCVELHSFKINDSIITEGGIIDAGIKDNFIVVVTGSLSVYVNVSLKHKDCYKLPNIGLSVPPLAIHIVYRQPADEEESAAQDLTFPPLHSLTESSRQRCGLVNSKTVRKMNAEYDKMRELAVLVSSENGELFLVDFYKSVDLQIDGGPYNLISSQQISSSSSMICLLSSKNGAFRVYSSASLSSCLVRANVECLKKPHQMQWVGEDCLALSVSLHTPSGGLQHVVFVGGLQNEWLPFTFDEPVQLVSEFDGLRVITRRTTEFISRVAPSSKIIFSLGSCNAAAMLLYTLERMDAGDVVAEEILRTDSEQLEEATALCLDAATHEIDVQKIIILLRACVLGRNYMEYTEHDDFLSACRDIRVCVSLRQEPWDLFISVHQLRRIGYDELILKLLRRKFHLLALRICHFVGIPPTTVVMDWAKQKIQSWNFKGSTVSSQKDFEKQILSKLSRCPDSNWARIALIARDCRLPTLCFELLKNEKNKKVQVQLLLSIQNFQMALDVAIEINSIDMIYKCIFDFLNSAETKDAQRGFSALLKLIKKSSYVISHLYSYAYRTRKWKWLKQLAEETEQFYLSGWVSLHRYIRVCREQSQDGIANGDVVQTDYIEEEEVSQLSNDDIAKQYLAFAAGFFGSHTHKVSAALQPSIIFAHKMTLQQIDLLSLRNGLMLKSISRNWKYSFHHHKAPVSLFATLVYVIKCGELTEANKIRKHFGISDKQWWYAKLKAAVETDDFDGFYTSLSEVKFNAPIQWSSLVSTCYKNIDKAGAKSLGVSILQKLDSSELSYWSIKFGVDSNQVEALINSNLQDGSRASVWRDLSNAPSALFSSISERLTNVPLLNR